MWRFQFTFRVIIQLGLLSVAWGQYSVIFLTVEWHRHLGCLCTFQNFGGKMAQIFLHVTSPSKSPRRVRYSAPWPTSDPTSNLSIWNKQPFVNGSSRFSFFLVAGVADWFLLSNIKRISLNCSEPKKIVQSSTWKNIVLQSKQQDLCAH